MSFIWIFLLLITMPIFGQVQPCKDYTCDSLAVRAILDSNGLINTPVTSVTRDKDRRITELLLSDKNISTINPEIGQLQNLFWVELEFNQITSIPEEIGQLQNLKTLWLKNNQLTSIPEEIGTLKNLESLSLSSNQLTFIPKEIGQLKNLRSLSLSSNQLSSIPPEIVQLEGMWWLFLEYNQLTSLPPEITQLYSENSGIVRVIRIENNRLCNMSLPIFEWLLKWNDFEWWTTQTSDGITPCEITVPIQQIESPLETSLISVSQADRGSIIIRLALPTKTHSLSIYALNGSRVKTFQEFEELILWSTSGQSRGVYFLRAVVDGELISKRFVLM